MEKESRRLWPLLPKIVRASWKLFRHVGNWGINVEFNIMESGVVLSEVRGGNFTVGVVFNNCMAVDASMYNTYYTEESIGASNMARYINQI